MSTLTLWNAYVRKGQTVWKKKQNRDRKKLSAAYFPQQTGLLLTQCKWFTLHWGKMQQKPVLKLPDRHPKLIPDSTTTHPIYISVAFWKILMVLLRKRMLYTLFDLIFCNMSAVTSEYSASAKLDTEANTYTGMVTTGWRLLDYIKITVAITLNCGIPLLSCLGSQNALRHFLICLT